MMLPVLLLACLFSALLRYVWRATGAPCDLSLSHVWCCPHTLLHEPTASSKLQARPQYYEDGEEEIAEASCVAVGAAGARPGQTQHELGSLKHACCCAVCAAQFWTRSSLLPPCATLRQIAVDHHGATQLVPSTCTGR